MSTLYVESASRADFLCLLSGSCSNTGAHSRGIFNGKKYGNKKNV